jgi:hypothetical protein
MAIKGKTVQLFGAATLIALFAGSAQAMLVNSSFESPDASAAEQGCPDGWGCFNSSFTQSNLWDPAPPGDQENPTAHSGSQILKQFGNDAGATQRIAVSPGEKVEASVYAQNWSGDPWTQLFLLQIAYFDGGNNNLGADEIFANSDGAEGHIELLPQDGAEITDWTLMEVSGIAPAGSVEAQILLLHIAIGGDGAIFLDDANLTAAVIPVPAAVWLFGSALGLLGFVRRRMTS